MTRRFGAWGLGWVVAAAIGLGGSSTRGEDLNATSLEARIPSASAPIPNRLRFDSIGLSIPSPHQPGKIPVVFIHGLWIGPRCWEPMIRALEADREVAAAYQFWTFGYASGDPLPYSAYQLRTALDEARGRLDPDRSDHAFDRMVVVGHSMGGLLAKLVAVDSGDRFWRHASDSTPDQLAGDSGDADLARQTLIFRARPEIRTVVFIATPHRGGTADQWLLHDVATRLVRKPDPLMKAYARLIAANPPEFFKASFRTGLVTSIDQMRWDSPTLADLLALTPPSSVAMHSIIPVKNGPLGPGGDDGIVAFASAHLDGVASETIVPAGHFCLENPAAIARLRRILADAASPGKDDAPGFQLAVPSEVR
ncbi:esterase/lipase family protein [Planctomyces sp. SH-PL62]|uniref:esterase/lipase family protein n=1 Tax=Planctomyces sp. SH-PL62 TaxID=1636152 RepID=UPI00078CBBA5|nr:alpha/beta hydrolase [Planctomyces sp. SH-PL62]AMV37260.1 Alpha/beta hydrolase family protein [Planctomyces sp. SH-PL62]